MKSFLQKHESRVTGAISGFDRLVFRGTIRQLAHLDGMHSYLATVGVLLKDFGQHAQTLTTRLKEGIVDWINELGRPVVYMPSSQQSKEEKARAIAQADRIDEGTIALLTAVEPCQTFDIFRNRERKQIELKIRQRKCLFLYHYFIHPQMGFMHARIQSWFPFNVQVCLNGREWLARQMDQAKLGYAQRDNCFVWLEDAGRAQKLLDAQLRTDWPSLLDGLACQLNPRHADLFGKFRAPYYWSTYQSEWATDIMFKRAEDLASLYPRLIRHGISSFSSPDVLRFLGRYVTPRGKVPPHTLAEITSDSKRRPEGVRLKHRLNGNSIKLYDKQGSVLRAETTIVKPRDFKVYRPKEGEPGGRKSWRYMRQGVADLYRRAELSQRANERYLQALAVVDDDAAAGEIAARACKPTRFAHKRVRALRPWAPDDLALLRAVNRGNFVLNGLRNRDLIPILNPKPTRHPAERRRRAAAITRKLRLLRAHGILRKVPRSHRYQVTLAGRRVISVLLAAYDASPRKLAEIAA